MSGIRSINLILIIICFLSAKSGWAQQKEELRASLAMTSKDGRYSCTINSVIKQDVVFAGHFLVPGYSKIIMGKSGHGYDFLDYETSGVEVDFVAPKWIENKFFLEDLEGFSLGPDVKKAVSFHLNSVYSADKKSNRKAFIAKFAALTPKNKIKHNAYDEDCDVKLFYKLLYPDSTGSVRVDYLNKLMPDYHFELNISAITQADRTIESSPLLFNEIKKSINESSVGDQSFDFSANLGVYPPEELGHSQNIGELANHNQAGLASKIYLVSDFSPDTLRLEHPVYYANLKFPFRIFNDEKIAKYRSYKTKNEIFMSSYEIIVIPISYKNGILIADVISNYSKLNLNDGTQRWSPFKKRIEFKYKEVFIDYPRENWSAVFSRGNENYEIYGYSDYEKYIAERLSIKLQKVCKEK